MINKKWIIAVVIVFLILAALFGSSYWFTGPEPDQEQVLEGTGIFNGQIDSQSVEIEFEGQPRAFMLGQGVSVDDIRDGTAVTFFYAEKETRPVLLSINAAEDASEILHDQGVYTGQIDSHSVEIVVADQPKAFAISEGLSLDHIEDGSRVVFIYRKEVTRPLLLSIEMVEAPIGDGNDDLVGEGILEGQIDAQSVEILLNRVFMLGSEVSIDGIDDGSLVAFTYSESGPRAVLDSIKKVDEPVEGEVIHGILIGQSDSQSVEIQYYKAFVLGAGVTIEGIPDGAEVIFTYREGLHRPLLTSITLR